MGAPAARRRQRGGDFWLVGVATFLFWFSLYLYVPILPLHARTLGASLTMVGAVVASYAIAQVLLRIPIGVGADLIGRRKPFA
ncbi:MAG: MFS transporter, partial [Chloroflexi bacterium]|nr:MFS transporter [Chloroflexota bacterium]